MTKGVSKAWVQRSKVLATWSLIIFGSLGVLSLVVLTFFQQDSNSIDGIKNTVSAAATLAGVTITGYMGNSGLEKYTNRKFQMEELLTNSKTCSKSEG